MWASGDHQPTDGRATGFDSILDNTNFTGGPFSYYVRQSLNFAGTGVSAKQRFSLLPNLRPSKAGGQQNFVNPGLCLFSVGAELAVTPRLRAFLNASAIRFDTTAPLQAALHTNQVARALGTDLSIGLQWRPLLTDNIVVSSGLGVLLPSRDLRDRSRPTGVTAAALGSAVDPRLHSATLAIKLTY